MAIDHSTPAETTLSPKVKIAGLLGILSTLVAYFTEAVQDSPDYEDPVKILVAAAIMTGAAWLKRDPLRR